jgi:DNA polymerase/3'-5' exonuclease PolX
MRHAQAIIVAEWLMENLRPGCERIEIAGSLRRGRPEVHDIEIVAKPYSKAPIPVFGNKFIDKTMLDRHLRYLEEDCVLKKVKGGDKYKQYTIGRWEEFGLEAPVNPFNLDLFVVTPPAQWGVQMVIRTGPNKPENNFSQWMVTQRLKGGALPGDYYVKDGAVWEFDAIDRNDRLVKMPEEKDFFTLCGLEWMEPDERVAKWRKDIILDIIFPRRVK